jgi:hypothetical protein
VQQKLNLEEALKVADGVLCCFLQFPPACLNVTSGVGKLCCTICTWSTNHSIKLISKFYVLLTVHLDVILVNDQLDALFLNVFISRLCMFRATSAHHQEDQLPECVIPDVVLTQVCPPDDEHMLLETCRGVK